MPVDSDFAKFKADRDSGFNIADIASKHGVSEHYVCRSLLNGTCGEVKKSNRVRVLGAHNASAILDMYSDGLPIREISKEFGVTPVSIYKFLNKRGVSLNRRSKVDSSVVDRITSMNGDGVPVRDIVNELGVSQVTVYKHLKDSGIKLRKTGDVYDDICKHYSDGKLNINDIASKFGVCRATVFNVLRRRGVICSRKRSNTLSDIGVLINESLDEKESFSNT